MAKLTRPEKVKVGVAVALIALIIAGAFGEMNFSFSNWGLSSLSLFGIDIGDTGGTWKTVDTWHEDAESSDSNLTAIEAKVAFADVIVKRGTGNTVTVREQVLARGDGKTLGTTMKVDTSNGVLSIGQREFTTTTLEMHRVVIELPKTLDIPLERVLIDTEGGDVDASDLAAKSVSLVSSAGDVEASNVTADDFTADSSAGDVSVTFSKALPASVRVASSAGDVELTVPRDAGFTLQAHHSAGDFDYDGISLTKDGSQYRSGDGSAKVFMDASAGDLELSAH